MVRGFFCGRHCVASTWRSSDAPMPKEIDPTPPFVQVWLSPQTSTVPGSTMPSSGPITCTMPLPSWPRSNSRTPVSAARRRRPASSFAPVGKVSDVRPGAEDTAWSGVAKTRSGRATA